MIDFSLRRPAILKPNTVPHPSERAVVRLPLSCIVASPYQPRRVFSENSIAELAESIRQHGLLTPLLVRRISPERYELIAGERRLRALTQLQKPFADAIILSAYDHDCALLALIENLQRENLHYLDEAEAFRNILAEHHLTQDKLAQSLCISSSALANRLRLLKLSDAVRCRLRETGLSERHARALLRLSDEAEQLDLIETTAKQHLSVKQLEAHIERALRPLQTPKHQQISRVVRDNRIVINAVLDTVRELRRIGVSAESRVEERNESVDIIVTIRSTAESCAPSKNALH